MLTLSLSIAFIVKENMNKTIKGRHVKFDAFSVRLKHYHANSFIPKIISRSMSKQKTNKKKYKDLKSFYSGTARDNNTSGASLKRAGMCAMVTKETYHRP